MHNDAYICGQNHVNNLIEDSEAHPGWYSKAACVVEEPWQCVYSSGMSWLCVWNIKTSIMCIYIYSILIAYIYIIYVYVYI